MKAGEDVHGYRIVTEPTNSGGGRCVWAFAERGGREYFIKQFLDPKYPTPSSMGSEAGKKRRRTECEEFEARHRAVNERINPTAPGGGNLVTAVDFFREDTCYYKVTERVAAEPLLSLTGFSLRQIAVVIRTLCLSIQLLHRAGIVHGDLKPANVLFQQAGTGALLTAKVIDFDDAYPSGSPPPPEHVVGDLLYGAPEWMGYVKLDGDYPARSLTTAADVFSLGLVVHTYLTGELPGYDRTRFGAPAEAVAARVPLDLAAVLSPAMTTLLGRMTAKAPADRPRVDEVFRQMSDDAIFATGTRTAARPAAPTGGGRRLLHTMTAEPALATPPPSPAPLPPPAPRTGGSRIRTNLPKS
jgi:serine/threonine protein kinase